MRIVAISFFLSGSLYGSIGLYPDHPSHDYHDLTIALEELQHKHDTRVPNGTGFEKPEQSELVVRSCESGYCETIYKGPLEEFAVKKGKGKGSGFADMVASGTGHAIGAVASAVGTMQDAAVSAGFHSFQGTLSGPRGTVSFSMDFTTGQWSVSGGKTCTDTCEVKPEVPEGPE